MDELTFRYKDEQWTLEWKHMAGMTIVGPAKIGEWKLVTKVCSAFSSPS